MFFNSIKLVLFCLITLINLNRSISYKWTPFDCNNNDDPEEVAETLKHVVINKNSLYFFFKSFVVSMWVPEFTSRPGNSIYTEEINLVSVFEPLRVYYENISEYPNIMDSKFDKFHVFEYAKGSGNSPDKTDTYLINSKSNDAYYFETDQAVGVVGKLVGYNNWVKKYTWLAEDAVGFDRYEHWKFFEVHYKFSESRDFEIWHQKSDTTDWMGFIREQIDYKVKFVVYYEFINAQANNLFTSYLIEVDDKMKVHVHFYVFCSREKNDFKILTHHKETFFLTDFLSCRPPEKLVDSKTTKGIYSRIKGNSHTWFYFKNDYYHKSDLEVKPFYFANHLPLDHAGKKHVLFLDSKPYENVKYELATIKYIKYYDGDIIYYAKDDKESWELEFKDVDKENETLVAKKRPDLHVHECLQSALVIETFYFCFFQKYYYYKSSDGFRTVKKNEKIRSISSIFEDSEVVLVQDVELIFLWTDKIVFMTYSWNYYFHINIFTVKKDLTKIEDADFEIVLKIKRNIPKAMYNRVRHCYWSECE